MRGDTELIVSGVVLLVLSVYMIIYGRIWNLVLAEERYIVATVSAFAGILFLYVARKK